METNTASNEQLLSIILNLTLGLQTLSQQVNDLTTEVAALKARPAAPTEGVTTDGKKAWPPGFLERKMAEKAAKLEAAKAALAGETQAAA